MAEAQAGGGPSGGHFVAATFISSGLTRKMGEIVHAGVSVRDRIERKLVQHLGIAPSEA
jgi:hypothetical protein